MSRVETKKSELHRAVRKFETDAVVLVLPEGQAGLEYHEKVTAGQKKAARERFSVTREVVLRLIEWFEKG
jgi:hypothetical protein